MPQLLVPFKCLHVEDDASNETVPTTLVPSAGRNTQSYHFVGSQRGANNKPDRPMKDFLTSPESSVALRCQGRPNVVSATTVLTLFETNGRGQMCLGQLYDPTLVATDLRAHIVSHTTLKTDVGVVGSVTVNPRATRTVKKCNAKKGHDHSCQENHAPVWRTQLSIQ